MVAARYTWTLLAFSVLAGCPDRPTPRAQPPSAVLDASAVTDAVTDAATGAALEAVRDVPLVLPEPLSEAEVDRFADAGRAPIADGGFVYDGAFVSLWIAEEARRANPTETDPEDAPIDSFRDPRVLVQLARDPLFLAEQPGRPREDSALYCHFGVHQQSCVPDPCIEEAYVPCVTRCSDQCSRCDQSCRPACFACNAACTTDACRAQCAQGCARCLDGCRSLRDRCSNGECSRRQVACRDRFERDYQRVCRGACRRCFARFPTTGEEIDYVRRERCVRQACGARMTETCLFSSPESNDPEDGVE